MREFINRRNFRQEYNLLRIECEEVRKHNILLKREMIRLLDMMSNRKAQETLQRTV